MRHSLFQSPANGESGDTYNKILEAERLNKLMASDEEVKGRQFILMLDKALKHGKLMNHWLEKARLHMAIEKREKQE